MSIRKILKKALTPELFAQVELELGEDYDVAYVPQKRLSDVIKQRNELREQLNPDDDGEGDEDKAPATPKTAKVKGLTPEEIQAKVDAEVAKVEQRYAVTEKLREAKVRNPKLLLKELDLTKDIDEQVAAWKLSDPYMFDITTPAEPPAGTGKDGGKPALPDSTMSDEDYYKSIMPK